MIEKEETAEKPITDSTSSIGKVVIVKNVNKQDQGKTRGTS